MLSADLVLAFVLLDVVIILAAARLCGRVALRMGQPRVVGEIVAGVLLGPTVLGPALFGFAEPPTLIGCHQALGQSSVPASITSCLFPPQARTVLGLLGQVGLIFFMFLVGLELDWGLLRGRGKGIAFVSIGAVVAPVALGLLVGPLLYNANFVFGFSDEATRPPLFAFSLMVGAMLSVTAFPVMARILQEKGLTSTAMGATGIAAAAVVTVLMFLVVSVAVGVTSERSAAEHLLNVGAALVYIAVLLFVVKRALLPIESRFVARGLTMDLFAVILMVLLISSVIASRLGVNVIVGSFLVGAVLPARIAIHRELSARLADLTTVMLLPIFLAFSGLQTDFTKLRPEHALGIAIFLAAGIAGKWGGSAVAARLGGLPWSDGNVLGILMNCRGLLVLVVALVALNQGIISQQLQVGAVLMALLTTAMTGPLFDRFSPPAGGPVGQSVQEGEVAPAETRP